MLEAADPNATSCRLTNTNQITLDRAYEAADDGEAGQKPVSALAEQRVAHLFPEQNVRTALARFDETESEVLPVLASASDRKIVGYLTEAYAARRYAQEQERRRSAELGEQDIFSIGPAPSR